MRLPTRNGIIVSESGAAVVYAETSTAGLHNDAGYNGCGQENVASGAGVLGTIGCPAPALTSPAWHSLRQPCAD